MALLRQTDLAQRAGKSQPVQQAEREGDDPGPAPVRPGRPSRPWTISAATNTMLSAIAASTGWIGTCTKPSVAAASVMLCATVNAVIVATRRRQERTAAAAPKRTEDGRCRAGCARSQGRDRSPRLLSSAACPRPRKRVRTGRCGPPASCRRIAAGAPARRSRWRTGRRSRSRVRSGRPAQRIVERSVVTRRYRPGAAPLCAAVVRPSRRDGEAQVASRRHLPERLPGLGAGLLQLQIGRPHLVRLGAGTEPEPSRIASSATTRAIIAAPPTPPALVPMGALP